MKRRFGFSLAILSLACCACGDEAGMSSFVLQWDAATKEWNAAFEAADPALRREMLKTRPNPDSYVKPLWRQLEPILNKPEALPGVVWIFDNLSSISRSFTPQQSAAIVEKLFAAIDPHLVRVPGIGQIAYPLSISTDLRCRQILEKVREQNPDPRDQGLAALGLAVSSLEKHGLLRDDPRLTRIRINYIREATIKSYYEPFGRSKVSTVCSELMYEINNLYRDRKAPPFQITSSDGVSHTFPSGNPELLIFCSASDPNSMALVSKADAMMERYPGLKVTPVMPLKGSDAPKVLPMLKLPVPVMLDEKSAVFKLYRVTSLPFVYFVDGDGMIRMRGTPDMVFDMALEQAFKQSSGAAAGSASSAPAAAKDATRPSGPSQPVRRPEPESVEPDDDAGVPGLRPMPEL